MKKSLVAPLPAARALPAKKSRKKLKSFRGRAPASGARGSDGYVPVTRDDVDDLALLPRRFDLFAADVRQSFEILAKQILPKLDLIAATQNDHGHELNQLTQRVTALETHVHKRKTRKKRTP